jgi:flavin reductase (DIM6/NTAB) family NADH-FMN oxidoreductase RutF
MKKKSFPLSKVYQLLTPGPVVMVTTSYKGKDNVMTMSWHMMIDFDPPLIGCVIDEQNYSFKLLKKTKECVINIPTVELAPKVVAVGNISGSKVDKFKKFNISKETASQVEAPLIGECYANLECKVVDMKMASKYNIFILEVLKAWVKPIKKRLRTIHHCGGNNFIVDGKVIKVSSKK